MDLLNSVCCRASFVCVLVNFFFYFNCRWVKSAARKDDTDENIAKYDGACVTRVNRSWHKLRCLRVTSWMKLCFCLFVRCLECGRAEGQSACGRSRSRSEGTFYLFTNWVNLSFKHALGVFGCVEEFGVPISVQSKARHHAIAANLKKPFHFVDKPFVVQ